MIIMARTRTRMILIMSRIIRRMHIMVRSSWNSLQGEAKRTRQKRLAGLEMTRQKIPQGKRRKTNLITRRNSKQKENRRKINIYRKITGKSMITMRRTTHRRL